MSDLDPAVYRKAADVLRAGGWTQGTYEAGHRHCAIGALRVARGQNAPMATVSDQRWARPLADLLGSGEAGHPSGTVVSWNDEPERTAEDVITLLEQAAEKLEADR